MILSRLFCDLFLAGIDHLVIRGIPFSKATKFGKFHVVFFCKLAKDFACRDQWKTHVCSARYREREVVPLPGNPLTVIRIRDPRYLGTS